MALVRRGAWPVAWRSALMQAVATMAWKHRGALLNVPSALWDMVFGSKKSKKNFRVKAISNFDRGSVARSDVPTSSNYVISNPTYWAQESIEGDSNTDHGVRILGRQYLVAARTGAADVNYFAGAASIRLGPDVIGGRLALLARTYDRYAFRHVRIIYIPTISATTPGAFTMAFVQDGTFDSYAGSNFELLMQLEPSIMSPMRQQCILELNYSGPAEYYTENDSSTSSGQRQTNQGILYAFTDLISPSTSGHFIIEYVCDLHQPCIDLGFTMPMKLTEEERDLCVLYVQKLRDEPEVVSSNSVVSVSRKK